MGFAIYWNYYAHLNANDNSNHSPLPCADDSNTILCECIAVCKCCSGDVHLVVPALPGWDGWMPIVVQYPGKFELKIIGTNEDGFVTDIRRAVAACLTKGDDNVVSCTTREKGRYTSISLKVFVDNSAQLYKVRWSFATKYPRPPEGANSVTEDG